MLLEIVFGSTQKKNIRQDNYCYHSWHTGCLGEKMQSCVTYLPPLLSVTSTNNIVDIQHMCKGARNLTVVLILLPLGCIQMQSLYSMFCYPQGA